MLKFNSSAFFFFSAPCAVLSGLLAGSWAHVDIPYPVSRIVSYRIVGIKT